MSTKKGATTATVPAKVTTAVKQQPKVAEKKAWKAEDYVTMTIPIE